MNTTASAHPAPTAGPAPAGAALRLVEPDDGEGHARHRHRNAFRDEEHDLQGHALALESLCLRRRAARYADAIDHGAVLGDEQVDAVLRAFRSYRPFVFAVDRRDNDAAHRRLARAVAAAQGRPGATHRSISVA